MPEQQPARPQAGYPAERRIAPLGPAQRTQEQRQLLSTIPGDDAPNLFSTVVQHPDLYRTWLPFCMQLLTNSVFPVRERELLIIRTASLCGSAYELHHHVKVGSEAGLTDHELASLTGETLHAWGRRERLLVAAAEELHAHHTIRDATWRGLSELLTTEQLIELPMLVGHYILLAGTIQALGVPVDGERTEPNTAQ